MATYPTGIVAPTNPTATQKLNNPSHSSIETVQNNEIVALETKVGVDSSAVVTTIDYLLKNSASIDPGHLHTSAGISGAVSVAKGGTGAVSLTNHGVVIGQATAAVAVTGAGTTGQVLTSNGASADPTFQAVTTATKLAISVTGLTVVSSVTETALATVSVPGGTLGTANAFRYTFYVSSFVLTAAKTATFRLKYGSTTMATNIITNSGAGTSDTLEGTIECLVMANAATNAQKAVLLLNTASDALTAASMSAKKTATGTAVEDSTATLNFILTVQFNNNSTNDNITTIASQGDVLK